MLPSHQNVAVEGLFKQKLTS